MDRGIAEQARREALRFRRRRRHVTVDGARRLERVRAARGDRRTCRTIVRLADGDAGGGPAFASIRAWRAACHTTRARSWRSPCPTGIGSLGGGGRYDNLIGMFLGRDVPACGFSLGLERIIVVMTERNMFPRGGGRGAVDVMVTFWTTIRERDGAGAGGRAAAARAFAWMSSRRRADKFEKQFKYASARSAPGSWRSSATTNGRRGEVASRDLATSEQDGGQARGRRSRS